MEIKEIQNRSIWENFVSELKPHTFLHSWEWGDFNKVAGYKIYRLGIWNEKNLEAVALIIKMVARRASFLFCPHGPILKDLAVLPTIIAHLKNLAAEERCNFIRISPNLNNTPGNAKLFRELGFRKAPIHMHAELMWILNIEESEGKILKDMRKTTRYLINKAEKDGVVIESAASDQVLQELNNIYKLTSERQRFTPFSLKYLENEFLTFSKNDMAKIFLAKYKGEVISAAMIIFDKHEAYYHHGASDLKHPKVPASYLLQWRAIQEAKRRGCHYYNFWGIAPSNKPGHPWSGLTTFKTGFGGRNEEYLPAQDLVINYKYWINYLIESARRIKRGL